MIEFTDAERSYLKEMRALTTDTAGREILVGLSLDETEFYMTYARSFGNDRHSEADKDRYLQLHDKHEAARFAVLGAENELRLDDPPLQ